MHTLKLATIVLLLATLALPAAAADVLQGEILDMSCFISRGARGPSHTRCAQTCAENGMPLGLLTDEGTVYLLYPEHGEEEAFDAVKKLAGTRARLTGKVGERKGVHGMEVQHAEAAK